MSPEARKELEQHMQAISKILYAEADQSHFTSLSEIEMTIRRQLHHGSKHYKMRILFYCSVCTAKSKNLLHQNLAANPGMMTHVSVYAPPFTMPNDPIESLELLLKAVQ